MIDIIILAIAKQKKKESDERWQKDWLKELALRQEDRRRYLRKKSRCLHNIVRESLIL